jgi:hypothetical protein
MALEVLAAVVLGGIVFIVFMVHVTGRWVKRDDPDTGTALLEFGRVYPGEAIRSIVNTTDGKAHFYRLHGGKTGFLQQMGHHSVARVIEAGSIHVSPLDNARSLKIDFRESGFPGGVYNFDSEEDAAEVSLWLCGTFAMAAQEGVPQ